MERLWKTAGWAVPTVPGQYKVESLPAPTTGCPSDMDSITNRRPMRQPGVECGLSPLTPTSVDLTMPLSTQSGARGSTLSIEGVTFHELDGERASVFGAVRGGSSPPGALRIPLGSFGFRSRRVRQRPIQRIPSSIDANSISSARTCGSLSSRAAVEGRNFAASPAVTTNNPAQSHMPTRIALT